jgi:hypothetical protein
MEARPPGWAIRNERAKAGFGFINSRQGAAKSKIDFAIRRFVDTTKTARLDSGTAFGAAEYL